MTLCTARTGPNYISGPISDHQCRLDVGEDHGEWHVCGCLATWKIDGDKIAYLDEHSLGSGRTPSRTTSEHAREHA